MILPDGATPKPDGIFGKDRSKLTAQFANYAPGLAHLGGLKLFDTSALGSTTTNTANSSLENIHGQSG